MSKLNLQEFITISYTAELKGVPERIQTSDPLLRSLAVNPYIIDSWSGLGWFPSPVRVSPALIAQHIEQRLFVPRAVRRSGAQTRQSSCPNPADRCHIPDNPTDREVPPC
jgi:hypothetical protein